LPECDWRLFILDECHIAEVLYGELDMFYGRTGIDITRRPKDWESGKTRNYMLAVSATGFSWQHAADSLHTFELVYMRRSPLYTGLPEMYEQGRFHKLSPITNTYCGAHSVSGYFKNEILPRFLKECKLHGNGYCILRLQGKALKAFIQWCVEKNYRFHEVTMAASNNIGATFKSLTEGPTPSKPEFILISGSYRAGMRIKNDSHIRVVVETSALKSPRGVDSLVQSLVGRSMGYNKNNPYPIYCQIDKIEEALEYVLGMREGDKTTPIPENKNIRRVGEGKYYKYNYFSENPFPNAMVRLQSKNKEDFSAFIAVGKKHSSHDNRIEVYHIDQMTNSEGEPLCVYLKRGFYVRGDETEYNQMRFVDSAPFIAYPQMQ
jgi:hypothetical protein